MPVRVLSGALSAMVPLWETTAENGIEAFPVEVEVNCGWGDTIIVPIISISPIVELSLLQPENAPLSTSSKRDIDTDMVWAEKVRVK